MAYKLLPALLGLVCSTSAQAQNGPQYQSAVNIKINPAQRFQGFDGIGISEAFQRSLVLHNLDVGPRNEVLDFLFGNVYGAGLTILRNGLGSSPDEPFDHMKSIAPVAPASNYSQLNYIPLPRQDQYQVWLAKEAKARGVNYIYADAWSADGYMKTNGDTNNGGYLCGVTNATCASGDWRQSYANKIVRYIQDYQAQGIEIDYVGFLNEPDFNASYASMLSDGQQAADFIKVLHPTLQKAGLRTQIACCDATGWEAQRTRLEGIQAAGQEQNLGLVTSHGYSSAPGTPFNTPKKVWQTEWSTFDNTNYDWYATGSQSEGLTWANHIQSGFANSNLTGHIYWWGAANATDNEPLIFINNTAEVRVTARLWAHAHFGSRFIKKDATRIGATVVSNSLNVTAYQNPDTSIAVQVINNGNSSQSVTVSGLPPFRPVITVLTNQANNLTQGFAFTDFKGAHATIPAHSLLSFQA